MTAEFVLFIAIIIIIYLYLYLQNMYNCMEFDANRRIIPILCDSYAIGLELCDYPILVGIMRKIMLA